MWVRNKKSKFSLKSKILLGALTLVVMVGLGTAVRAASDNADNENALLFGQMSFFDPFTLRSTGVSVTQSESESNVGSAVLLGDPVRIPFRPALRSPFRPPLVLP